MSRSRIRPLCKSNEHKNRRCWALKFWTEPNTWQNDWKHKIQPSPLSDVALQQVKAGEKKPQYSSDRKYRIRVAYPVYSEHDWKENIGFYVTDGAVSWFQSVQYTTNRIESLTSGLFRKYAKTKRSFPWDCQTPAWGSYKYGKERKKTAFPILERFRDYSKSRNRSKTTADWHTNWDTTETGSKRTPSDSQNLSNTMVIKPGRERQVVLVALRPDAPHLRLPAASHHPYPQGHIPHSKSTGW